eukprot:15484556-Alexandrium_andersonii.AAC.1
MARAHLLRPPCRCGRAAPPCWGRQRSRTRRSGTTPQADSDPIEIPRPRYFFGIPLAFFELPRQS